MSSLFYLKLGLCSIFLLLFILHMLVPILILMMHSGEMAMSCCQKINPACFSGINHSQWGMSTYSKLSNTSYNGATAHLARKIIVITPTRRRAERLPDMVRFRLAQTLAHVPNVEWFVVEEGSGDAATVKAPPVERFLQRIGIPYVYLAAEATLPLWAQAVITQLRAFLTIASYGSGKKDEPIYSWTEAANQALDCLCCRYGNSNLNDTNDTNDTNDAVVYFADAANAYSHRLFNQHIRCVSKVGIWQVGLSPNRRLIGPKRASNGSSQSTSTHMFRFDQRFDRTNPIESGKGTLLDPAAFAFSLRLLLVNGCKVVNHKLPVAYSSAAVQQNLARFNPANGELMAADFLRQLGMPSRKKAKSIAESATGNGKEEILVWKTRTKILGLGGGTLGYEFERNI